MNKTLSQICLTLSVFVVARMTYKGQVFQTSNVVENFSSYALHLSPKR
jgi:hypothetical protein